MTLPVERSRSRRPVTWFTLVGVLLLPAVIGGILVGALYNPTERLDNITAAIVNDDKAVELDGQLVPLGRQLTGGLVTGSDDQPSNIDWVISNDDDAAAGLADGTYTAVVTIPENFTAASLSTVREKRRSRRPSTCRRPPTPVSSTARSPRNWRLRRRVCSAASCRRNTSRTSSSASPP